MPIDRLESFWPFLSCPHSYLDHLTSSKILPWLLDVTLTPVSEAWVTPRCEWPPGHSGLGLNDPPRGAARPIHVTSWHNCYWLCTIKLHEVFDTLGSIKLSQHSLCAFTYSSRAKKHPWKNSRSSSSTCYAASIQLDSYSKADKANLRRKCHNNFKLEEEKCSSNRREYAIAVCLQSHLPFTSLLGMMLKIWPSTKLWWEVTLYGALKRSSCLVSLQQTRE